MSIIDIAVKRPVTLMLTFPVVTGLVSMGRVPRLMPEMNLPYAAVITSYAPPVPEVETLVTKPLESSLPVEQHENVFPTLPWARPPSS